jgi:hypothetical protein
MTTFRPARAIDAPELISILEAHYDASRYAGLGTVDRDYTRKLLAQASCRNGHTNDGGCWFEVMEGERGIEAFILGTLQRTYMIGDKFTAQDVFFIARPDAPAGQAAKLLDHFIEWARGNPRCIEVMLTHTDVLPDSDRAGIIYRRKGAVPCGAIYRISADTGEAREAA